MAGLYPTYTFQELTDELLDQNTLCPGSGQRSLSPSLIGYNMGHCPRCRKNISVEGYRRTCIAHWLSRNDMHRESIRAWIHG